MNQQKIWVVYCTEEQQYLIPVAFSEGMTAQQALFESRLAEQAELPEPLAMGIYGLKINDPSQYIMQAGDRLELYRPLKMNPKDVRRKRAQQNPVGRFQKGNQYQRQKQQKTTD